MRKFVNICLAILLAIVIITASLFFTGLLVYILRHVMLIIGCIVIGTMVVVGFSKLVITICEEL